MRRATDADRSSDTSSYNSVGRVSYVSGASVQFFVSVGSIDGSRHFDAVASEDHGACDDLACPPTSPKRWREVFSMTSCVG